MTEEQCGAKLYIIEGKLFFCTADKGHDKNPKTKAHNVGLEVEVAGKVEIYWENHDTSFDPVQCKNCKEIVEWNETTICHDDECVLDGCLRCFECQICLSDYCLTHMVLHTLNQKCSANFETEEGEEIIPLQAKVARAEEGGYYTRVVGMKGCITQGENIKELRENLQDAVNSWLDTDKLFSFELDFVIEDEFDIPD